MRFFIFVLILLSIQSPAWALNGCPRDPQGLMHFVSQHIIEQRSASFKAQVSYHGVGANVTFNYLRVADAGHVSITALGAMPRDEITHPEEKTIYEMVTRDPTYGPDWRHQRELTEENYNFTYLKTEGTWFEYSVEPKDKKLQGVMKSGFVWLDPETCSIRKTDGEMNTESDAVPKSHVTSYFDTINGVYIATKVESKFTTGLRFVGPHPDVVANTMVVPSDVKAPGLQGSDQSALETATSSKRPGVSEK